jgi:hypothetical protein
MVAFDAQRGIVDTGHYSVVYINFDIRVHRLNLRCTARISLAQVMKDERRAA